MRYEYHPQPTVTLEFFGYDATTAPRPPGEGCDQSQAILRAGALYDAVINVKEEFYDDIQVPPFLAPPSPPAPLHFT